MKVLVACEFSGIVRDVNIDGSGRGFRAMADFWATRQGDMIGLISPWESGGTSPITWLPRQDQLQEMILTEWKASSLFILHRLVAWLAETKVGYYEDRSLEQLWLAFVMQEKYGKMWDSEKNEWSKAVSPESV